MSVRLGALAVRVLLLASALMVPVGCDKPTTPTPVTVGTTSVRIVFQGSTARRPDLPTSADACVNGVGATHIHPGWRDFAGIPMTAMPPAQYEITFSDVPVNTRVSFRVNDQNACDENPTGAVTRNIFANGLQLAQNASTPGDEPGFAFSVTPEGVISQ